MARAGCKGIYDSLTYISEWVSRDLNKDAWWNYHCEERDPHQIIEWLVTPSSPIDDQRLVSRTARTVSASRMN
jgi:hypothetical protein